MGVCLGRRLTIEVYGAVPIEVHFSEHLVQLRTHQWLPQQSRCCLSQLCHRDSPIPVPVKLVFQQGSALPTQSCLCLYPPPPCHILCLDAHTIVRPHAPPPPRLRP